LKGITVVCVKLIPRGITKCIEHNEASIEELLSLFQDYLENSTGIIVVVNGKPVENYNYRVSEKDEVVIVEEFMGG